MKSIIYSLLALLCFLSSCATASFSEYPGIGRIKQYDIYSKDLPSSFDGFKVAFAADFHYESRFTKDCLDPMVRALRSMHADVLLLGGDYQGRNGGDMDTLFASLKQVLTPFGTYAVMGNHDYARGYESMLETMKKNGIRVLEHESDFLCNGQDTIIVSGVRDPFNLKKNGVSPSEQFRDDQFVLLLTHTPDYAEDVDVSKADLVLAGHTHGGQVSLMKKYSPAHFSKYGNRFLTGKTTNTKGIPVIITNGLGTSRADVRLFTPSEVVMIVLHCKQ